MNTMNSGMRSTLQRRMLLLTLLPRHPRRYSAPELTMSLAGRGIRTSLRTVERDLEALSGFLPIACDDRQRPYGWFWTEEAPLKNMPALDPETALTLRVLLQHAGALLPPSARDRLAPYRAQADAVLEACGEASGMRMWPERVRVLPGGPPLRPPPIGEGIFATVQQGLLERRVLRVGYRAMDRGGELRSYRIHPLGLVFREPLVYLVVTIGDYEDPRHLAVHRLESAELTDEAAKEPESGFDLDALIASGSFDYPVDEGAVVLELYAGDATARYLCETPLADDQHQEWMEEDCWYVTATVQLSARLRWWLLSLGADVEIAGPATLREAVGDEIALMASYYEEDDGGV